MIIREYDAETDCPGLQQCVISIQDHEHNLDPNLPSGKDIVEAYLPQILESCKQFDGKILVADTAGNIAGYGLILTKVTTEEVEDGDIDFRLIRDLSVLERYRGQGIGSQLLSALENEAKIAGVTRLRIEVLNSNEVAKQVYLSKGFTPYTLLLEKTF
ncbi:MAG: GNAT superfamily N-acetyltransferase [Saprospiraceae bacterium]|jgi:GNAT superfamily N-acetyltransferase